MDEHRHTSSSIGNHFRDKRSSTPKDLTTNCIILKKCNSKFDCLIYEMFFFINELRPSLNVQCDLIRAKVFKYFFYNSFLFILFVYVLIVFNTPLCNIFMLFRFVTSLFYYIISIYVYYIFTLLDNDR